jgi:CheY-like chemotaxis protein
MKRILVVDDDQDILESLRLLLESYYETCLAVNGTEALMAMERGFRPDAILLDLTMPVMDGADFLREMKRRDLKIPVIVVSSHPDAAAKVRELGIEEVIGKPFTYEQLKERLERVLQGTGISRSGGGFLTGLLLG